MIERDMNDGYRTLSRWIDRDAFFRPPFGEITLWTWLTIRRQGVRVAWWTINAHDIKGSGQYTKYEKSILQKLNHDGGGVILLHCHDRSEEHTEYVLKITEQLLLAAKKHGLQVCTVSELFGSS